MTRMYGSQPPSKVTFSDRCHTPSAGWSFAPGSGGTSAYLKWWMMPKRPIASGNTGGRSSDSRTFWRDDCSASSTLRSRSRKLMGSKPTTMSFRMGARTLRFVMPPRPVLFLCVIAAFLVIWPKQL